MPQILNPNQQMLPHPYQTINDIPHDEHETIESLFTEGRCHIYAYTLQQAQPSYTLQAIYRDSNIQHIYCVTPEGNILDATGTYKNLEEYINSDLLHRYLLVEHKPITHSQIETLIEQLILLPHTAEAEQLAKIKAKQLNQI